VRRRAECTWLSPASYSASLPCRSANCFGVRLRARGCCGFRFGCAAQRTAEPRWVWSERPRRGLVRAAPSAPSAPRTQIPEYLVYPEVPWPPRSSSSAMAPVSPYCAAKYSGVSLHGRRRRGLGRRTRPIRRKRQRRTRRSSWRSRRHRMRRVIGQFDDCRRTPPSAARCTNSCARRGRGEGVTPRGYHMSPNRYSKTKQHAGSTAVCFWVNVNGREYAPRGLGVFASSLPLAHPSNVPNFRKSRKRRLRAKEAARIWETRQDGRGAYGSRNVTS
jgi:hypothetical protein